MNQTLQKTPFLRRMLDLLGLIIFLAVGWLAELTALPMWAAIIASALGALLSTKRSFGGAVFSIFMLALWTFLESTLEPKATFMEKMNAILHYESGSRMFLCLWIYLIMLSALSVLDIFRGSHERHS